MRLTCVRARVRAAQFALLAAGLQINADGTAEFHGFNAFTEPVPTPGTPARGVSLPHRGCCLGVPCAAPRCA